jgi:hypothetical protein
LVSGDSGGGDFIYNTTTSQWNLVGINEVTGTASNGQNLSGFVQLDTYASQMEAIFNPPVIDSPTLSGLGLLIMACSLFFAASRSFGNETSNQDFLRTPESDVG